MGGVEKGETDRRGDHPLRVPIPLPFTGPKVPLGLPTGPTGPDLKSSNRKVTRVTSSSTVVPSSHNYVRLRRPGLRTGCLTPQF